MSTTQRGPEDTISTDEFCTRFVADGDTVLFGELFPGIYAADLEMHRGLTNDPKYAKEIASHPFVTGFIAGLLDRNAQYRRLRVLPSIGQNGCTVEDIQTEIQFLSIFAGVGENTRFTWFADQSARLLVKCGASPFVQAYLEGATAVVPRNSFWAAKAAGTHALTAVRVMSYPNNTDPNSIMTRLHMPPNQELVDYVSFWSDVFASEQSFDAQAARELKPNQYSVAT